MNGTNTKINEERILSVVQNLFLNKNDEWNKSIKSICRNAKVKFSKRVPYSWIKESLNKRMLCSNYIREKTDCGMDKKSETDGGVIYICFDDIKLPVVWIEIKSSNSCTTNTRKNGKGARGQATGLITEQAERCRDWCVDTGVKPLVAIMIGTDFDENLGSYNIDRIRQDLHTSGDINPYSEGGPGVSWLMINPDIYSDSFEKKIQNIVELNIEKMKDFLKRNI